MNHITAMDPELRGLLCALKECAADEAATLSDVVRVTDNMLACFDKIEEQRARELAPVNRPPDSDGPRCSVASLATHGAYYCSRDRGHDGPCAAHPTETSSSDRERLAWEAMCERFRNWLIADAVAHGDHSGLQYMSNRALCWIQLEAPKVLEEERAKLRGADRSLTAQPDELALASTEGRNSDPG